MTFAERVRLRRDRLKMTQLQLAEKVSETGKVKIGANGISHIERGRNQTSHAVLIELARVLECTTEWLLGASDDGGTDRFQSIKKWMETMPEELQIVAETQVRALYEYSEGGRND